MDKRKIERTNMDATWYYAHISDLKITPYTVFKASNNFVWVPRQQAKRTEFGAWFPTRLFQGDMVCATLLAKHQGP